MKPLYQFYLEQEKEEIKLYNLSYDIEKNDDEDKLHDENFLPFLYESGFISTDIEFQFVDINNLPTEDHTHYVIKPVATTIVFGSDKDARHIINELLKHEELNFALQELKMHDNKIEGLVINNHFCDIDDFIKDDVAQKITPEIEKFNRTGNFIHHKKVRVKLMQ